MKKNRKEVFIMKNQKMWKGFVFGLCITALTGCGTEAIERTGSEDMHVTEYQSGTNGADASQENQNNTVAAGTDEKVDAESLYASAIMRGSVVDFSDEICTVSVAVTEDDGKTGVVAAPGHESEDTNVVVTYQEGCVVQIATIYTSTGTAELEQASIADIKKQASVIIYGSYEDTHHISADQIIICHWTA